MLLATTALAQTAPPIPDRRSAPTLAAGPDGDLHAAWTEGSIGEQTILYSRRSGSTWSAPEVVVAGASVIEPVMLVRPDGVPCVLWTLIALSQSCREGGVWSVPIEVARETAAADFAPAYGPDGLLRVLHIEPPNGVYYGDLRLNPADEVVTFGQFAIDTGGGLHAFWFDFTEDRGWVWSHSTDDGSTWSPFESLSTSLPQSTGTLVGADANGGVHSVLVNAFSVEHRRWSARSGWSDPRVVAFAPGAIHGGLAVDSDGAVTVAAATAEGALTFRMPAGGDWQEHGVLPGTEGRSIDAVLTAPGQRGRATVLWHEVGAAGFNESRVEGESLVSSLPGIGELNLDPVVVATSVALTAGVVFLMPFPAEVFNNTLAGHYGEIRGWFRRRRQRTEALRFWDRPGGLILFVVISALLFGFLDPAFGLNGGSVPTYVGLLFGVAVTTLGFALPTLVMRRAKTKEWGKLRALPLALVVGVGCVVLSRIIGFLPGYLYGIVLGVAFRREVTEEIEGTEVAVSSVVVLAVALASWVAVGAVRSGAGAGFVNDATEAALATITVSAFEGLAIGLLPLRGMPGKVLFATRRRWWVVIWAISVLAFFHALIDPQSGYLADSALVPVAVTVGLLVVFAGASLGLWGFFTLRDRRRA
jgi:hypothetical protein